MNELSPERTRQALHPAMHEKILVRAAELVELGWTRGTAARDADGQKSTSPRPWRGALWYDANRNTVEERYLGTDQRLKKDWRLGVAIIR